MSGMRVRIMPVRGCSHADAATKGMHPPLRQAQSEAMHAWSTTHARTLTGGRCPALLRCLLGADLQRTAYVQLTTDVILHATYIPSEHSTL
jgi:hypothetical protein